MVLYIRTKLRNFQLSIYLLYAIKQNYKYINQFSLNLRKILFQYILDHGKN